MVADRQVHCTYVIETQDESEENAPKEEFLVPLRGCRNMCQRQIEIPECCPGYWGHDCTQECPGGAGNPCSGHGNCSDTIKGTGVCTCQDAYGGAVCEFCRLTDVYGPGCNQSCQCLHGYCDAGITGDGSCDCESGYKGQHCDEVISPCDHVTCVNHSRCVEDVDGPACACNHGYEMKNDYCQPIDLCQTSALLCHPDATCETTGAATYDCKCKSGFEGDGVFCLPIDPCLTDHGGCPRKTTHCIFNSPGQSECMCRSGYENYTAGVGCTMIDLCRHPVDGSPICDKDATCRMEGPGRVVCTCNIGFIGSGHVCFGNIMQRIVELNNTDETLRGRITKMAQLLSTVFGEMLRSHGPYTLFIPVDDAFEQMEGGDQFAELLEDVDAGRHLAKQHLLPIEHTLSDLVNTTSFYTLAGVPATLSFRRSSKTLAFRLIGSDRRATVLEGNLVASNGIMHVIDTCMNEPPIINGQKLKTLGQQIREDGRYNRFESLIEAAGLSGLLDGDGPLTVFVSSNKVWDSLPEGTLQYLRAPEGRGKLLAIMRNHIVFEPLMSWDLLSMTRFTTYSAVNVMINLTRAGQIQLDGHVNVTQTDIRASNGYYHHISGALIPQSVKPILPSRCDQVSYTTVKSLCNPCHMISCPAPGDKAIEGGLTYGCVYSLQLFSWAPADQRQVKRIGCHRSCNRTIVTRQCCPGFYGEDCRSCPGGFFNPCYGRGQCVEGYYGTGECLCQPGFHGTVCELCDDPNKFGPNCDQECTCLHGTCDSRVEGTGTCTSCQDGYTGLDCQLQKQPCGPDTHCHVTEICVHEQRQCVCEHGYRRVSEGCEQINPCTEDTRGGCHSQAQCVHTGPGQHECQCETGWSGDGFYCRPIINCTQNSHCHSNAQCLPSSPAQYECVCNTGYYGNGSYCELNDTCLVNNGGCHPDASCEAVGDGTVSCTCPDGLAGDGRHCYGDILREMSSQPNLISFYRLLQGVDDEDDYLHDVNTNYTVFAPINAAMTSFINLTTAEFWRSEDNVLTLLSYHTVVMAMSLMDLRNLSPDQKLDTLAEDYTPIEVTHDEGAIYVNGAKIVKGDIFSLNGRIHLIDKVLEPRPMSGTRPTLHDFLNNRTDLSYFGNYILESGMSETVEEMDSYTLFIPTDEACELLQPPLTAEYVRFYMSAAYISARNLSEAGTWPSLAGDATTYQLNITPLNQQVLLSGIKVRETGFPTAGGIVYILNNILPACSGTSGMMMSPCDVNNGGCGVMATCAIDKSCQLTCMCEGGPNITLLETCPASYPCDEGQGWVCNPSKPRSAAYIGLFKSSLGTPIVITVCGIVVLVLLAVFIIRFRKHLQHLGSRSIAGNWSRLTEHDDDDQVHFTYEPTHASPTKFENPLYKASEERVFLED